MGPGEGPYPNYDSILFYSNWPARESNSDGGEILHSLPDRPWGTPVSCPMGTGSLSRG